MIRIVCVDGQANNLKIFNEAGDNITAMLSLLKVHIVMRPNECAIATLTCVATVDVKALPFKAPAELLSEKISVRRIGDDPIETDLSYWR